MPGRDVWRNRKIVRIVSCIDMVFAVTLISLYIYDVIKFNNEVYDLPLEEIDGNEISLQPGEKLIIKGLKLICSFIVNIVQFLIAYQLFYAIKEGRQDNPTSISKASCWQRASLVFFIVLVGKLVMFLFFGTGDGTGRKMLFGVLDVLELSFRAIGMYFVKEFIDDLKTSSYVTAAPRAQFFSYNLSAKRQNPTSAPQQV